VDARPEYKMPATERAKQFLPFAALKGLPEALAAKERITVPKAELSSEMAEELDRKMHLLRCGCIVTVIYFQQDEYLKITGMIARIDVTCRLLQIVTTKISFDDIAEMTNISDSDF